MAGAYRAGSEVLKETVLRKTYRIIRDYQNKGPLRYPLDYYDWIWVEDQKFHPSRLPGAFYMPLALKFTDLKENPPLVLQTERVLARRDILSYIFPLEKLRKYYLLIYFAGVMPVSYSFDVLINGNVMNLDYHVRHAEVSSVVYLANNVNVLKVSFRNVSFYTQVNGIEIYEVAPIPPKCSATTVPALQVIQQSTGFDLE